MVAMKTGRLTMTEPATDTPIIFCFNVFTNTKCFTERDSSNFIKQNVRKMSKPIFPTCTSMSMTTN